MISRVAFGAAILFLIITALLWWDLRLMMTRVHDNCILADLPSSVCNNYDRVRKCAEFADFFPHDRDWVPKTCMGVRKSQ
jgi:uncharacterized cysteine cluster protein YcgN (CxxCxxCC family)